MNGKEWINQLIRTSQLYNVHLLYIYNCYYLLYLRQQEQVASIMFPGCPSVRQSVRPSVRPSVRCPLSVNAISRDVISV